KGRDCIRSSNFIGEKFKEELLRLSFSTSAVINVSDVHKIFVPISRNECLMQFARQSKQDQNLSNLNALVKVRVLNGLACFPVFFGNGFFSELKKYGNVIFL
ncbi:hypothetical protein AVEN_118939-1, partial [Araneus ventricosus]